MKNTKAELSAVKFSKLDFYDDKLVSVSFKLASSRKGRTTARFEFADEDTDKVKTLIFENCANVRFFMDFDTMADNWYAQTDKLSARANPVLMKRLVHSQLKHWRVKYMPPTHKTKPINRKLSEIRKYALFEIAFKGGTIELLARDYKLRA